jgi:hypothetical protein
MWVGIHADDLLLTLCCLALKSVRMNPDPPERRQECGSAFMPTLCGFPLWSLALKSVRMNPDPPERRQECGSAFMPTICCFLFAALP